MNNVYLLRLMLMLQLKIYVTGMSYTCLNKEYCPAKFKHLACTTINGFSVNCGTMMHSYLPVNGFLRENILQHVNVLRNLVASGMYGMQPAGHMPAIAWDRYLADMAKRLAYYCDRTGTMCSNSKEYNYVSTVKISGNILSKNIANQIVNVFLPIWFNDVLGCQMDANSTIVAKKAGSCVGHYIPLIEENGDRMGCAMRVSKSRTKNVQRAILICNFSRANVNGLPHYQIAKEPGSKCAAGKNPLYKFLCDPKEVVNYNVTSASEIGSTPLAKNSTEKGETTTNVQNKTK